MLGRGRGAPGGSSPPCRRLIRAVNSDDLRSSVCRDDVYASLRIAPRPPAAHSQRQSSIIEHYRTYVQSPHTRLKRSGRQRTRSAGSSALVRQRTHETRTPTTGVGGDCDGGLAAEAEPNGSISTDPGGGSGLSSSSPCSK